MLLRDCLLLARHTTALVLSSALLRPPWAVDIAANDREKMRVTTASAQADGRHLQALVVPAVAVVRWDLAVAA